MLDGCRRVFIFLVMDIETKIANTLIQRPAGFTIADRHFYIYPTTLGRIQMERDARAALQPDIENMRLNSDMEIARIVAEHPDEASWLIAYATTEGRECMDNEKVAERVQFLKDNTKPEDLTTLFLMIVTEGGVTDIQEHFGIDKELKEYRRICNAKEDKGTYTFCGKSIYGAMIAPLAEKYGWTLDYILWDISFANLQMLMADAPKTVMLTEDERKRIHPKQSKDIVKADDMQNFDAIMNMNWD